MKTSIILAALVFSGCGSSYEPSIAYKTPNPNAPFASPSPNDIYQLSFSDCWLMAELAALALETPQVITNAITLDGNQYTVRFFDYENNYNTVYIKVSTNDFDPNKTTITYNNVGQVSYWGALIETAYGKWRGENGLNVGGLPSMAFEMLVGEPATDLFISNIDERNLYEFLLLADNGVPLAISTNTVVDTNTDIQNNHAYTVMNAANENEITIRNTWGTSIAAHRNGIENVSVGFINRNFIILTVPNHYIK